MFSDILDPLLESANKSISESNELTKQILAITKPPAGPYAIFHHFAHLVERIRDVKHILTRMVTNKGSLVALAGKQREVESTVKVIPGKSLPNELNKLHNESNNLTERMKLDLESLYVFGNLILDQWSYVVAYATGMKKPETVNFRVLVEQLQSKKYSGVLSGFWQKHKRDMIWLYYQLRFYRSTFIEHVDRPWQRGSGGGVFRHDFNIFTPTPPGWYDDQEIQKELESIFHLAPTWIKDAPDDYWEKQNLRRVLEVTINQIEDIDTYSDREKVWNVWRMVGGSTPSYEIIGRRLLGFIESSIPTLGEIIASNPGLLNLGKSKSDQATTKKVLA